MPPLFEADGCDNTADAVGDLAASIVQDGTLNKAEKRKKLLDLLDLLPDDDDGIDLDALNAGTVGKVDVKADSEESVKGQLARYKARGLTDEALARHLRG